MSLLFDIHQKGCKPRTSYSEMMTLGQRWGYLKAPKGRRKMGEECDIILNIYCSLQTDLGVPLKPGGGLVSVQAARILGPKATENKSLCMGGGGGQ